MISFRYHLVSIAAVLLALAAGVALGAGPLSDSERIAGKSADSSSVATADLSELHGFQNAYAAKTGKALTDDRLKGASVVFFTLPGANEDQVNGLKSAFEDAGASIAGTVALEKELIDSKGRQFAEGVAQQATKGVKGVSDKGESYTRIGSALGRAFLAKKATRRDAGASTIGSAFAEGGLIGLKTTPEQRGELAVMVAGPDKVNTDQGQGDIATALVAAFSQIAKGAILAGPTAAGDENGYVEALRADELSADVSSIDVIDAAAGRLVATMVAQRELSGKSGAYGTSRSSDGAIPQ